MFNDFDLDIQKIGVDYSIDQNCCGNMGAGHASPACATTNHPADTCGDGGATRTWSGNLLCQILGGC